MRFKLFFLVALLIHSCTNSDKEAISLFNFLPSDSNVIISINDLKNTKEILNNNKLLPIVLSTSKEISNQLGLLSNNNSDRKGLFSLSTYGKNEIAFTYIRKSNSFDTISEGDTLKNKYQKSEIFLEKVNGKEIHKVIIDQYIVSSNKDIILENIIRDFYSATLWRQLICQYSNRRKLCCSLFNVGRTSLRCLLRLNSVLCNVCSSLTCSRFFNI